MINLLPPSHAARIRYGRQNVMLRRWIIGVTAAIAGLVVIFAFGLVYITQQTKNLQRSIEISEQQLKNQDLEEVKKEAESISNDIKTINKVLGQEIRFSSLIQSIGRLMPNGSALSSLSLSKVDGAIDLSVKTVDHKSAVQVAANLGDPKNDLFEKVDVVNVNCNAGISDYKCSASIKALFSKSAQTKFINVPVNGGDR